MRLLFLQKLFRNNFKIQQNNLTYRTITSSLLDTIYIFHFPINTFFYLNLDFRDWIKQQSNIFLNSLKILIQTQSSKKSMFNEFLKIVKQL